MLAVQLADDDVPLVVVVLVVETEGIDVMIVWPGCVGLDCPSIIMLPISKPRMPRMEVAAMP